MKNNELDNKILELENRIHRIENNRKFHIVDFIKNSITRCNNVIGITIAAVLTTMFAYAAQITFTDGTVISAGEVNNNFTELYSRISELESDAGVTNDSFEVAGTTTITTTSSTWTNMTDLSITPGVAGTYLVIFSSSVSNGTNDQVDVGLAINTTIQSNSIRSSNSSANDEIAPINTQTLVTLATTDAVRVRWKTSNGTASMYQRTLTAIRLD